jgi:hypothetical protein
MNFNFVGERAYGESHECHSDGGAADIKRGTRF